MNISNEENFVYSLTIDQRKLYHYYKNAATEQLRRENDQLRQQVAKAKDALQVIAEKTPCFAAEEIARKTISQLEGTNEKCHTCRAMRKYNETIKQLEQQ